jgi:hypothetical protein
MDLFHESDVCDGVVKSRDAYTCWEQNARKI